ncbi:bacteriocin immunity protein [Pseudomonas sp. MDT1-16]
MSEHPAGSDLIFYRDDGADDSAVEATSVNRECRGCWCRPRE